MAKRTVILNESLIKKQKLSQENILELYELHRELDEYLLKLEKAKNNNSKNCKKYIKESDQRIRNIEFRMQKEWKFDLDEKKHTHWIRNPFCSCSLKNNYFGRILNYNPNCEVHSPRIYSKYFNNFSKDINSPITVDLTSLNKEQKEKIIPIILKTLKG